MSKDQGRESEDEGRLQALRAYGDRSLWKDELESPKKNRDLSSPCLLSFVADDCFDASNLIVLRLVVFGLSAFGM